MIRLIVLIALSTFISAAANAEQVLARDIGIAPGILPTGKTNTIVDVPGVKVGQLTKVAGDSIRTGVTVVLPHGNNLYQHKVPAAIYVENGYGKLMGLSQVTELGEIETPIALTNTLSVPTVANALISYTLSQTGNETVRSVNAVVGETNDGLLNDIRGRHITQKDVLTAIDSATSETVMQGNVGAGTGTVAFGFKGGIGSSSRRLPAPLGGYLVGVLVQTNYGGVLQINGMPVGQQLNQYYLKDVLDKGDADGSVMIVIATDAPLSDRNLKRLAKRAFAGIARTGASFTNGSGDYAIAFSVADSTIRTPARRARISSVDTLPNGLFSPLSQAVIEATEEAVYNSLLMAEDVTSLDPVSGETLTVKALPVEAVKAMLATARPAD
ncbi:P1 family peptidase [Alteromonas gilva]|uniref:P1 family peptidase n=1 Tax=Alteromonas gilva TaxID=2987522 RepID=A0ABT5L396_9ALTE|nr:P1 family peptidase [Alteromonas gilva]MDC8831509.1 P1 family peptidase [Alteromonas gilva]